MMECRVLLEDEFKNWDRLVDLAEGGTIFHKSFWFSASGRPFSIIGCFNHGELVGGLPIIRKKWLGIQKGGLPLFTPYADIIWLTNAKNKIKKNSFGRKVIENVLGFLKNNYQIISLGISPIFNDFVPLINSGFEFNIKITYRLSLDTDIDARWNGLCGSRRTDIRNAEKAGFRIIQETTFKNLSRLISKTYERQYMENKRVAQLASSYVGEAMLQKKGLCFIAYDKNYEPHGGVFLVWDRHCAYYLFGGFDHEKGSNNAVTFAMWKAIHYAREELGLHTFDFEGSLVPQLETFFRRFGGDATHFFRAKYIDNKLKLLKKFFL